MRDFRQKMRPWSSRRRRLQRSVIIPLLEVCQREKTTIRWWRQKPLSGRHRNSWSWSRDTLLALAALATRGHTSKLTLMAIWHVGTSRNELNFSSWHDHVTGRLPLLPWGGSSNQQAYISDLLRWLDLWQVWWGKLSPWQCWYLGWPSCLLWCDPISWWFLNQSQGWIISTSFTLLIGGCYGNSSNDKAGMRSNQTLTGFTQQDSRLQVNRLERKCKIRGI